MVIVHVNFMLTTKLRNFEALIPHACIECIILLDNVSRVQMKATPLPGSDYINASFVDVSIMQ